MSYRRFHVSAYYGSRRNCKQWLAQKRPSGSSIELFANCINFICARFKFGLNNVVRLSSRTEGLWDLQWTMTGYARSARGRARMSMAQNTSGVGNASSRLQSTQVCKPTKHAPELSTIFNSTVFNSSSPTISPVCILLDPSQSTCS
jgi:hypothetical protein